MVQRTGTASAFDTTMQRTIEILAIYGYLRYGNTFQIWKIKPTAVRLAHGRYFFSPFVNFVSLIFGKSVFGPRVRSYILCRPRYCQKDVQMEADRPE